MIENEDYVLETNPAPAKGEMEFNVRLISGDFVETTLGFSNLTVVDPEGNGNDDDYLLQFDYAIKSSPDPDLTEQNKGLQEVAGVLLYKLITEALENAEENNERKPTADNT